MWDSSECGFYQAAAAPGTCTLPLPALRVTLLQRHVGHNRNLDHAPFDARQYRRDRKVDARVRREWMVVGHCYEQKRKPQDAAKRSRRKRPLIDRDSENLEH